MLVVDWGNPQHAGAIADNVGMTRVRGLVVALVVCVQAWSCGQQGSQPVSPTPPPIAAAQQRVEPPTPAEVQGATYVGLASGQITLKAGQWEKDKAYAALLDGFLIAGDLDRDGMPEAVVIITDGVRGGASSDYLAVLGRRGGQILNISTVKIGSAMQLRSAAVEGANVNLNVIRHGKDDQKCCPTEKATLTYTMPSGALAKANELVTGTASLGDLAGNEWLLAKFSQTEPVPPEAVAFLRVEGAKMIGRGPCNNFNAAYAGEPAGYKIKIGPVVATKMACTGNKQPLEDRFFKVLESVSSISFAGGRLVMEYPDKGGANSMVLTSRPITKGNAPEVK